MAAAPIALRPPGRSFDCVLLNPPYKKINSDSDARRILRQAGIETSNLYTAFLWLVLKLLRKDGEFIAITPRSFCNGPYFRPFREALLSHSHLSRIHVFDSRKTAFKDDEVLQENIIFRAKKTDHVAETQVSTSHGPEDTDIAIRDVEPCELVHAADPDRVIHIVPDELQQGMAQRIRAFPASISDLGIQVSTGRIVDFRAREALIHTREQILPNTSVAPLIYPVHLENGGITWPRAGKKPNYFEVTETTKSLLVPPGFYVLVKRFSAKEEKRRVVASICDPGKLPSSGYAFENLVNYYHSKGEGLTAPLAKGLALYLNSGLVDSYFRQFSGHTQVNASDLRNLPYPDRDSLCRLGKAIGETLPTQDAIDHIVERELPLMDKGTFDPLAARKRIDEALFILKQIGLPRAQLNDRSALTLLALLDLKPTTRWSKASSPLMGITPIMEFSKEHYGTTYAPNTRETFRRQTMHQFVEAGIALHNSDQPDKAVNSPKANYQIAPSFLETLRSFGTAKWERNLAKWMSSAGTLKDRYAPSHMIHFNGERFLGPYED